MSERDPAAARFAVIQLVRLTGVALFVVGLLIQSRRLVWAEGLPTELGYVLMVVGLVEVFALPALLARHWRSPRP
ncbi:MAG: hypothetical protein ABW194_01050 [Novosphingobium sp.]